MQIGGFISTNMLSTGLIFRPEALVKCSAAVNISLCF